MAYSYSTWFAQASSISGWTSGTVANIQGLPVSVGTSLYDNIAGSGSFTADVSMSSMASAPGDDEGWWIWFKCYSLRADGIDFTVAISDDSFSTTLFTSGTLNVIDDQTWFGVKITDAAMDGATLSSLSLRFSGDNQSGSTNRFYLYGVHVSKSPYTAAQQPALPSGLTEQEYHAYILSDLEDLFSAGNGDSIPVIPDASGNGCHLFIVNGTAGTYNDTNQSIDVDGCRYAMSRGSAWTTDVIFHWNALFDDVTTDDAPVTTRAGTGGANDGWSWQTGGTITDKHVTGTTNSGPAWVMMVGDGSPGVHITGGTPATATWYRTTWFMQQADNDMMWIGDSTSATIDAASGANDFRGFSSFARESNDRYMDGQLTDLWVVEADGLSESDVTDAADEWVNGIVSATDDGALLSLFGSMIG